MNDQTQKVKPHSPHKKGAPAVMIDLEDLARKAVTLGPLHVFGETILNLCLMTNDLFRGGLRGSNLTGRVSDMDRKSKDIPHRSRAKKSGSGGAR